MLNHPKVLALGLACAMLSLMGCSSVENPYIPKTVGQLDDSLARDGVTVTIRPEQSRSAVGQPIVFDVRITNSGDTPVWIPKKPQVVFTWTYPDGKRDNFLQDVEHERFFKADEAVLLQPGQTVARKSTIATYYFGKSGITEFRAVIHSPRNTNADLQPFWNGRVRSNSFGVLIDEPEALTLKRPFYYALQAVGSLFSS